MSLRLSLVSRSLDFAVSSSCFLCCCGGESDACSVRFRPSRPWPRMNIMGTLGWGGSGGSSSFSLALKCCRDMLFELCTAFDAEAAPHPLKLLPRREQLLVLQARVG